MAPEIFWAMRSTGYDARIDSWSMGVTLYEMSVLAQISTRAVMTAQVTAEVESVHTRDASAALEEDMDNFIHLAKCVNQRILSFSTQAPLVFAKPPDILSEPYSNIPCHLTDPNTGLYELDS